MTSLDKYLEAYERQFDYWDSLASKARGLVEGEINGSGIRAIVTSRAKSTERLRGKINQRNRSKKYQTPEDIEADIIDRAGVRVALYFPSQQAEVEKIILKSFSVFEKKEFPDPAHIRPGSPRFTGYRATHYRCTILPDCLNDADQRYLSGPIEIQVASVLMHAWSEVEHDLVYKPLEGELSDTEYSLLDQLNGLVQSGEIALEELLRASDARLAAEETPFRSHYELGEYLRSQKAIKDALVKESDLGAIDVLFEFLRSEGLNKSVDIAPYLANLHDDFEQRPLADQVSDLMIAGDKAKYRSYRQAIMRTRNHPLGSDPVAGIEDHYKVVGEFVLAWADFENQLSIFSQKIQEGSEEKRFYSPRRALELAMENGIYTKEEYETIVRLMHARNRMLHGRTQVRPLPTKGGQGDPVRVLRSLGAKLRRFNK